VIGAAIEIEEIVAKEIIVKRSVERPIHSGEKPK
jgi:hypothetical protein